MSHDNKDNQFINEMSGVKPLQQDKVAKISNKKTEINSRYRQNAASKFRNKNENILTDGEVEPVEPEQILSFKLDGIQPAVFKKLRQGKYEFDYHLDLHRKTVAEARDLVFYLLKSSIKLNYRCLLITHGKGIQSIPPARLKSYVDHWLKQLDIVVAFHSALERHGGSGSVYVLLKKMPETNIINPSKYL